MKPELACRFPHLSSLDPDGSVVARLERSPSTSALLNLLTDSRSKLDGYRHNLDACLELARRHGILDRSRIARLTSGDQVPFYSAWYELKIALVLEESGGTLSFDAVAANKRVGEFTTIWEGRSIFVEVKTMFSDRLMQQWDTVSSLVFRALTGIPGPYTLDVDLIEPPKSGSLSGKALRRRVIARIREFELEDKDTGDDGVTYCDRSGCVLRLRLEPDPDVEFLTTVSRIAGNMGSPTRIKDTLRSAQRPKGSGTPCLVVLCLHGMSVTPDMVEPVLFGSRDIYPTHTSRRLDGLWGSRQIPHEMWLGAVGAYWERETDAHLRVYHCPWATTAVSAGAIAGASVEHFTLDADETSIVKIS